MGRKDVVKYIIQKKVPEMRKENQAVQTKNIILRWHFRQIHQTLKSSDNITSLSLSLKKCLIMSVSKSLLKNGESYGKKRSMVVSNPFVSQLILNNLEIMIRKVLS